MVQGTYSMTLSCPLRLGHAQALRVKLYPDFMCKKDRGKTYESTKVRRIHIALQLRSMIEGQPDTNVSIW